MSMKKIIGLAYVGTYVAYSVYLVDVTRYNALTADFNQSVKDYLYYKQIGQEQLAKEEKCKLEKIVRIIKTTGSYWYMRITDQLMTEEAKEMFKKMYAA